MFQTSFLGFLFAGRAFIWSWLVVFFGQMMVALQFAELAAHFPLAGSVYQWSKQVARQGLGLARSAGSTSAPRSSRCPRWPSAGR